MSVIKSFSVGNGDMYYIDHNSSNFTIIDCSLSDENAEKIIDELNEKSDGKEITRFISTHPDQDHISGLSLLDDKMGIINFYCVKNEATKEDTTDDFLHYCTLRNDSEKSFYIFRNCQRRWMNLDGKDQNGKYIGTSGINILWPILDNEFFIEELKKAKNEELCNNISPIIKYSVENGVAVTWMGDLETEFMELIKDEIELPLVDILFAPHHGRSTGKVPEKWLSEMNPKIIVIGEAPYEDLDYYSTYETITQNSAEDIVFDCIEGKVNIYISNPSYTVDFLDDEQLDDLDDCYYLGTLNL